MGNRMHRLTRHTNRRRRFGRVASVLFAAMTGVAGLVGTFSGGSAFAAAPTPVTAVSFTGAPQTGGATSKWTVGFTASSAGALASGNTITVTFASGFVIPATPTVTLPTGFTGSCGTTTGATSGQVVTITLSGTCALANSTAGTVTIAGIKNPTAGSYAATGFSVKTTGDKTVVNPASAVVIATATTPSGVTFNPASSSANSTSTWTVRLTPSSSGALASGNTVSVTFGSGFVVPTTPTVTFASGFTGTCTGTTTGTTSGQVVTITLSGTCALANSTAGTLTIAGIQNPGAGSYPASGFLVATSQDVTTASPASAVTINATTTTGVTFTPGSSSANSTSTWTVGLTPSSSGALASGNTVSVTFGPGFVIPATPTVTFATGFTGTCTGTTTGTTSGQVVTITLSGTCALANSTAGTIALAGIKNPGAGTQSNTSFSVSTSKDVTAASPAAGVTINATTTTGVTFTLGSSSANSTSMWTVGLTPSSSGSLASGDTISVTFGSGFVIPSTPTVTFASGFTGTCTGTTTGSTSGQVVTITLSGTCALANSTAGTLTVAGIQNPVAGTYLASGFLAATSRDVTAASPVSAVTIVPATHTVTFNANGGTGSMSAEATNVATALTTNSFTRAGYSFSGWNTVAAGGGTAYADGASYAFTADTTLYAQWVANAHTVTFSANGGTGSMGIETTNVASALTTDSFTRANYTFTGWNTAADGSGTSYADGASYAFTADTTLYAQWVANAHTVTFSANGGTGSMSSEVTNTASALSL
ncbi:MAG: cell wall/surface repeat protein, partial [Acidimicrobiaceae bacterium]|nr:cell wall/surface repeat protein [Acidimicrobiaceae bacterium]